jgi:hypothetical protein
MHPPPLYLLLPFFAGGVFALGSLCLKRSFREGATMPLTLLATNCLLGLAFLPLLAAGSGPVPWDRWSLPFLTGTAYFAGQLFNFLALRSGDVSLVTPVLGTKVVFVVLLGWMSFGTALRPVHGVAAVLTTAGVWLMSSGSGRSGGHPVRTTLLALASGASFAACDLMLQRWVGRLGLTAFLPMMFASVAAMSLGLVPWVGASGFRPPGRAWRWMAAGGALTAAQSFLISGSIGWSHDATGVNVVYTLRGLWAIALVWSAGRWLGNDERAQAGPGVLARRWVGATAILGAVVLAAAAAR